MLIGTVEHAGEVYRGLMKVVLRNCWTFFRSLKNIPVRSLMLQAMGKLIASNPAMGM